MLQRFVATLCTEHFPRVGYKEHTTGSCHVLPVVIPTLRDALSLGLLSISFSSLSALGLLALAAPGCFLVRFRVRRNDNFSFSFSTPRPLAICLFAFMSTSAHVLVYACMRACLHLCACVSQCVNVCIRACVCVHACTRVCAYTPRQPGANTRSDTQSSPRMFARESRRASTSCSSLYLFISSRTCVQCTAAASAACAVSTSAALAAASCCILALASR